MVGDSGTRLLFKLRSGTHGLNEELGRHRGREGKCRSLFVELPGYSERRALFLEHLKNNLGNEFEHFKSCNNYSREIAFYSGDRALGESL